MELINIFQTLKRWLWLILSIIVLTMVVLGLRMVFAKPVYAGKAKIQISTPQKEDVSAFDQSGSVSQRELIAIARNNFSDILLGDEVHARTVEKLGLQPPDDEFEPEIRTNTDSDFINLYVEASTPETAMNIANTLASEAILYYGELRAKPTEAEKELYLEQTHVAEDDYRAAELAFTTFLTENKISSLDSEIAVVDKLLEQLKLERDQRIITGNTIDPYTQIDALIAERQTELDRLLALKPMYTILETQAENARLEYQNALQLYTSGPRVEAADKNNREAQAAFIQFKTDNQVTSILDDISIVTNSLEQLQLERDRISLDEPSSKQIDTLIAERQQELDRLIGLQTEYSDLENKVQNAADNYQHVLDKFYEAELKTTVIREANFIQVIEPATIPEKPINNTLQTLVLGTIGSVGFAVVLAFVLDYFFVEDEVFSIEQIGAQSVMDLPVLGTIPDTNEIRFDPDSIGADAMRQIRTRAFLYSPNVDLKTILISSSMSGDGKTTIAANLSVAMESGSKKVLVIDADLRIPDLNEWFDIENAKGFSDLLISDPDELEGKLSKYIRSTDLDGVSLLTAGENRQDPALLLSSRNFPRIMKKLSEEYDHIIIDSPPILSSPDALVMAKVVDAVIVVVSPGRTKKNALEEALGTLKSQKDVNVIGLLFNRINPYTYGYYYPAPESSTGFFAKAKSFFTNDSTAKESARRNASKQGANGTASRQMVKGSQQRKGGHQGRSDAASEEIRKTIPKSAFSTPLGELQITPKKTILLTRSGYATIGELMLQMKADPAVIEEIKGFGPKNVQALQESLDEYFKKNDLTIIDNGAVKAMKVRKEMEKAAIGEDDSNLIRNGLFQMSRVAYEKPMNTSRYLGSMVSARIIARKRQKEQAKTFLDNERN